MANYKITKRAVKDKNGNIIKYQDCIIADMEKLTESERKIVEMYMNSDKYKVFPRKAKKKGGNGLTKEKMTKYLESKDKEGLKELQAKLKAKENFMRIMVWFKNTYPDYAE